MATRKAATVGSRPPRLARGTSALGFYQDVLAELGKVVWPSRAEVGKLTAVVIGTVIVVFAYIWMLDNIFTLLVKLLYGVH
jgi:preprotein translocase SecE subunit